MVYKHAYLNTLLLLYSPFMLSVVKMLLKGKLEAMHYIFMEIALLIMENHGKSWNCVFKFLWDP